MFGVEQDLWQATHDIFVGYTLVMARFSGFFVVSPFFSRRAMTRMVRLGVIAALSFVYAPPVIVQVQQADPGLGGQFQLLAAKELMIGYLLGVLCWLPLRGMELAGVLLDTQRGSTQAMDYDVIFAAQTTPTAIFMSQLFSGYFFAAGGYLLVVEMLARSFETWSPLAAFPTVGDDAVMLFIRFSGALFFVAVGIVLPISGFMLIADIVIAYLARSAQTLNALTFGMPVKSAIMLAFMPLYLPILYPKILAALSQSLEFLSRVFAP